MKRKSGLNIIISIGLQVSTIISGLIVPRLILAYFGSEVNGLISSLTQFLNYISLLEGGVTGVVMASLYKPLSDGDQKKISGIINAINSFFYRIGKIYIFYTIVVGGIYPVIVKTDFNYAYIFLLTIILAINSIVRYFLSLSLKVLLEADRKIYFTSVIQIITVWVNLVLVVGLIHIWPNIHIIKLCGAIVFLLQPICYKLFVNSHYKLDYSVAPDTDAISQRWDGFGQNLAYFLHTNTDMILLTLFSTLPNVSVYSVYFMVANSVKGLIHSVAVAYNPTLGRRLVTETEEKVNACIDNYRLGMSLLTAFLFCIAAALIVPFVQLYTRGVEDANYYQPLFGIVLLMAESIYCFREPYVAVAYASGKFRETAKYAYIEAAINLGVSLSLVKILGLVGVAVGTLLSMLYRMIVHMFYLKRNILHRNIWTDICYFLKLCMIMCGDIIIEHIIIPTRINSWSAWIFYGIVCAIVTALFFGIAWLLFYRDDCKKVRRCIVSSIFGGKK